MTERKLLEQALAVLKEFVADIDQTGGIVEMEDGSMAPTADEDWIDLAITYEHAVAVLDAARAEGLT